MIRVGSLSEEQRHALEHLRRRAVGRVSQRAHMVLLSARGYSPPQIADIFAVGEDTVRHWLQQFLRAGPAGLADRPRPGRPPKDRLARQIVDAQASNAPVNSGLLQTCWSVGLLAAFLAARFRLFLSASSVRRVLKQAGWRWARPRLAPASSLRGKRDPDGPAKLAAIAQAAALAATGQARLLYLDECDVQLLPVIRALWMKGERVRVPTPGTNAKRAFFGALDHQSGQFWWADSDRKLAIHFVAFLDHLVAASGALPLSVALDSAPTHTAMVVRRWAAAHPQVTLLWLPKYAAHEANPTERIWGLLKSAIAANRLADSIEVLTQHARRFLTNLAPYPVRTAA
jgi:transposase